MKNLKKVQDKILDNKKQPKILNIQKELYVAISSLAIGGAEMIVTDWLNRMHIKHKVHLIVLRNKKEEWLVPNFVKVTRVEDLKQNKKLDKHQNRIENLKKISKQISKNGSITIVCHLLNQKERLALKNKNNYIINIFHNAKIGWNEENSTLGDIDHFVCVSDSNAKEFKKLKIAKPLTIIKHLPKTPFFLNDTKKVIRDFLNIPNKAKVIGMVGSFKIQKNYLFAIKIFEKIIKKDKNIYLVILGGASSQESEGELTKIWDYIQKNKELKKKVRMPGFVQNASNWLCSFDLFLNTSFFEGLSIATLEAMSIGLPCLLSKVGGQGEITNKNTKLLNLKDSKSIWIKSILKLIEKEKIVPDWNNFSSYNLWTLLCGVQQFTKPKKSKLLFITSNLNLGGAQRSLVNLLENFDYKELQLLVAGNSTNDFFYKQLNKKIKVNRSFENFNAWENAFNIIKLIYKESYSKIIFWNVDPKLKLLLVKFLYQEKEIDFIDVSPGNNSYQSLQKTEKFAEFISFPIKDYYRSLKYLVSKFKDRSKVKLQNYRYIPNGVSSNFIKKTNYAIINNPKIVISGRITEEKFTLEILEAFKSVKEKIKGIELYFYGSITGQNEYGSKVLEYIKNNNLDKKVFFKGADFNVANQLYKYDIYLVLGVDQGSPNALLEAMSVGMPCIANDSGGTKEIIQNEINGLLLKNINTKVLSNKIIHLINNKETRKKFGEKAKETSNKFSIKKMVSNYKQILI